MAFIHELGHSFGRSAGGASSLHMEIFFGIFFENVFRELTLPSGTSLSIRNRERVTDEPMVPEELEVKHFMERYFLGSTEAEQ